MNLDINPLPQTCIQFPCQSGHMRTAGSALDDERKKKNRQFGLHFLLTPCFKLVCLDILDGKDLGQKVSCSVMQGKQLKKYPWGT